MRLCVRADLSAWMKREKTESKPSSSEEAKPSGDRPSLLKQLLDAVGKSSITPSWFPRQPKSGSPGVLLDVEYDGEKALAKLKLFDAQTLEVYEWLDDSGHHPYCFTDYSREEILRKDKVVRHSGFLGLEAVSRFDLLHDKEQSLVSIIAKDPLAIGGRRESIREIIGRDHSWEANIRYTHCYTMDRALTPGLFYRIQDGKLLPVPHEYSAKDAKEIQSLFEGDTDAEQLISEYLPLFLTRATYLPRIALDIEVFSPAADRIPDPESASSEVIAVSLADDTGTGTVFLLRREIKSDEPEKQISPTVQVRMFDDERQLLEAVFQILWQTPILLTYNGDNFDLRYLANRAKNLGVPDTDVPFYIRSSYAGNVEGHMKYGVHIDLYRFFHNRSIQIYAFRNQYREVRLEDVSQALLGEGKRELSQFITDLPYTELADYCWQDANLTMRLSQFNNDLVLNLILLLMRISHQGMHDLTRTAVSSWIRSLLYYAHRQRKYLIPRQDEIASLKGEAVTEAMIKGKKYMGAIVVEPKAGVHFDVTVLDFASLYPSIMKAYNLSYETVRCQHPECKNNLVPETTHWICTKRKGLTSLIIGVIRDVRVEYFKPRAKDKALSNAQRSWFSVIEQALKVYLNASYGVLGASHFPLYCAPAAESVTALGRHAIKETITKAQELGVVVLYGDTDSLFLARPAKEQLRKLIEYSEKELKVELDIEKVYRYVALSSRKKNYLGVTSDGMIDIKGLTGKKRNTPAFLQEAFMQMVEILRQVQDSEGFAAAKDRILRLAREKLMMLERRDFKIEDMAIRVQLTKSLDAYVKTTPQHVKAAKQLQAAGRDVAAGDIIAFVKTVGGVKPVEQASIQEIDISKYKDLVKSTFEQVLDALGIEWFDTIGMRRLDTFFG
jgi:DNA polymerase I